MVEATQRKRSADGGDPIGVEFDPEKTLVVLRSGNFYKAPQQV